MDVIKPEDFITFGQRRAQAKLPAEIRGGGGSSHRICSVRRGANLGFLIIEIMYFYHKLTEKRAHFTISFGGICHWLGSSCRPTST